MIPKSRLKIALLLGLAPVVALLCSVGDAAPGPALAAVAGAGLVAQLVQLFLLRRRPDQTRAFIQRLIDVIPEPVYIKDGGGRYIMINEAFAQMRGEATSNILGRSARELAPDSETAESVAGEDAEVLAGRSIFKEDLTRHALTGEPIHRIITKGSCLNEFGDRVIVGANFDVTGMRLAEQHLKAALETQTSVAERTQTFIQTLLDEIPYPMYVRDAQSRYLLVNKSLLKGYGLPAEAVIGKSVAELYPGVAQSDASIEEDQEVLAGLHVRKEEAGTRPLDGQPYHHLVIKGSCLDTSGAPVIVGLNIDVTRLRESERGLSLALQREREQHLSTVEFVQRILDLLPYPVYVKDAQSRFIMVNEAMARDSFIPRDELLDSMGLDPQASAREMRNLFEEDGEVLAGRRILREEQVRHPSTGRETFRILAKGTCQDARGEPVIVGGMVDLTGLRMAERDLKSALEREMQLRERTEAFIQRLIDVIPDPFYVKRSGRYLLINEAFVEYQGRPRAELLDPALPFPHLSEESRVRSGEEDRAVLAGEDVQREEHTRRRATGEEVYRIISKRRCVYIDGQAVVVGIDRHVTRWRQAEQQIKLALERETRLAHNTSEFVQRLIDLIPDPVYVKKSGGRYVLVNDAFLNYHQRRREDVLHNTVPLQLGPQESNELSLVEDERVLAGAEVTKEEHTLRRATGEEVFRIVTKRPSTYVDGDPVVVGIDYQITRWRVAERELQRLAREDGLTGLANRRHFSTEAARAITRAGRYHEALSVIMFDLDHFKLINDRWGHNSGDEVLRETVRRCQECLRATDLFARWGGEEFIVLLPHTPLGEASQVAERLRASLAERPVPTAQGEIPVTLSGGVAQWREGNTLDQLVSASDTALYAAKQGGRNRIVTHPDAPTRPDATGAEDHASR
ncbi:MAG: diguanylate cyclase [Candidatus Dactylopiibacterium sp.]|nr:diguanylate cyclase [Candidatus Dactylopiibacterium sp.]